jgi:hypothetical protein
MTGNSRFYILFSLLLAFSVCFTGCSGEPPPAEPATPAPAHPDAKFTAGDIIATPSSAASSSLYVILKYDPATDLYTRAVIEKNADGSWGHRSSEWTEKVQRASLEKTYTVKAGHVMVSILPVITPTPLPEITENPSGDAPSIAKISPASAALDSVVSVTITGSNFRKGAAVKLLRGGFPPINATVVSVTAFDITCIFNLGGRSEGSYTLTVINPDGKSDSLPGIFSIGETSPVIAGMYPVTGALDDTVLLTISGQNFRNEVKVTFTRGSAELVCDRPLSMESSRISCSLDLAESRGASPGEWNVTVMNIRDGTKGTWVKRFTVTNATAGG